MTVYVTEILVGILIFLCAEIWISHPSQCQVALVKEEVDALGAATPPLFDPLGEGVDVKDLDYSITSSGGGAAVGKKGKVRGRGCWWEGEGRGCCREEGEGEGEGLLSGRRGR